MTSKRTNSKELAMRDQADFRAEHREVTRRYFMQLGVAGTTLAALRPNRSCADEPADALQESIDGLESFLTALDDFRDVSRGKPIPHTLPVEKLAEVGLTRETWKLEVISDPEHPAEMRRPLTSEKGTALDFAGLLQLAEQHAVRFAKVMTCLNIGCPLGMGIWEGVPLRDVFWLTDPRRDVRRVFYYGYHNDEPQQLFQSSLPVDRILEDPDGLPPVILCYKLNGQWLTPERGGPVRIVVPEAYGFKSIKWLTHVVVSNVSHANDTYAKGNNDVDSRLKTFAGTLSVPGTVPAGQPFPLTGYAQVGVAGLSKVQVWIHRDDEVLPEGDKYFGSAPWLDARILPPPAQWGGGLPEDRVPSPTMGFDAQGRPQSWPMRLAKVHWAVLHPGLPPGPYTLRSRTIDAQGHAQPMPRPFQKSGHAALEQVNLTVEG